MVPEAKQEVVKLLQEKDNFLVSTCEGNRVDALASVLAFGLILQQLGKHYLLFVPELSLGKISFLPSYEQLKTELVSENLIIWIEEKNAKLKKITWERKGGKLKLELVSAGGKFSPRDISFGYGDPQVDYLVFIASPRSCASKEIERFKDKPVVNIDYHSDNDFFASLNWVDKKSVSMAEMLVALIESLEAATQRTIRTPEIATLLYASLYWATRGLKGQIPAKTFSVAAQLISWGADKEKVEEAFEKRWPAEFFTFLAKVWQGGECQNKRFLGAFKLNEEEKLVWEKYHKDILREIRAKTADVDEVYLVIGQGQETELWAYSECDPQQLLSLEVEWILKQPPFFRGRLGFDIKKAKAKLAEDLF